MTDSTTSERPRTISRRQILALAGVAGLGLRALARSLRRDPTNAPSHSHLKQFVPKIRTPAADQRKIIEQRRRVRNRLQSHLEKAKLQVARLPNAGSYAKETGIRRYMQGSTKIGGSDIDVPVILTARSGDSLELKALLDLFEGFVRKSYPRSKVSRTKSSIKLEFSSFKYAFDIVPMVAVRGATDREYLFRGDGSKVATSVSQHVKFIRARTQRSVQSPGIVRFNDVIRLFKWWRELRATGDEILMEVPTFFLDLLCAKAFDDHGVASSYTQTLHTWFTAIATMVADRRDVRFDGKRGDVSGRWRVLDPVSPENNVVPSKWSDLHVDRLAQWFSEGAATLQRVQERDNDDDGRGALRELRTLFGPAIGNLALLDEPDFA